MTKEIAQPRNSKKDIQELLVSEGFKQKVALALPRHCTPDRFLRVACNALLRTPKLLNCSQASLMKALLDLSTFGLEPDGRRAHLIPFKDEVQLIIDYKGLAELVRRSGDVSYIHADVVGQNDFFDFQFGSGAKLVHRPKLNGRGEIYAAYSFVRLKDGSEDFEIMGVDEIEKVKSRSKAAQNGPWVTDENEMRKKTVFRRHSKWLPLSPDVREAVEYDDSLTAHPFESDSKKLKIFNRQTVVDDVETSTSDPEAPQQEPDKPQQHAIYDHLRSNMSDSQINSEEILEVARRSKAPAQTLDELTPYFVNQMLGDWENVIAQVQFIRGGG